MTESKLVRLELNPLIRLSDCPPGLFSASDGMGVKLLNGNWHSLGDDLDLYGHTLVNPVRIMDLPAVEVQGDVQ
jgi:hypothetical protein